MHDDDGKCPACGEKETHLHYVGCQNKTMVAERVHQCDKLSKLLQKHHSYPGVISVLQTLMGMEIEVLIQEFPTPVSYVEHLLLEALTSQHSLGTNMVEKGLLNKD